MSHFRSRRVHAPHSLRTSLSRALRSEEGVVKDGHIITFIVLLAVIVLLLIAVVVLLWLDRDDDGMAVASGDSGPLATLEIVPNVIHVEEEARFVLLARPKDGDGNVIRECDCYRIKWRFDPPTSLSQFMTDSPHRILVAAPAVIDVLEVDVTASVVGLAGVQGTATVTVVPSALATDDRIESDHNGGHVEVALVSGQSDGGAVWVDEPLAFVGFRRLGEMTSGNADRVALFSAEREMGYAAFKWPGAADAAEVVEASESTVPGTFVSLPERRLGGRVIEVGLNVWIARHGLTRSPADAFEIARGDVRLTNDIFERNRVGVELHIVEGYPRLLELADQPDEFSTPCDELPLYTDPAGPNRPSLSHGITPHVIYVLGATLSSPAFTCTDVAFIFIDGDDYEPTQLAHELGHLFGLRGTNVPFGGHYGGVIGGQFHHLPGLGRNNFMLAGTTYDPFLQDYITLGQAFRMVVDARSFLNSQADAQGMTIRQALAAADNIPRSTETCQPEPDLETTCPKLCAFVPPAINQSAAACNIVMS